MFIAAQTAQFTLHIRYSVHMSGRMVFTRHGVLTIYTLMLVWAMDTILTGYVHINAILRSQT